MQCVSTKEGWSKENKATGNENQSDKVLLHDLNYETQISRNKWVFQFWQQVHKVFGRPGTNQPAVVTKHKRSHRTQGKQVLNQHQQHCALSAAHYSPTVGVGPSSVGSQCFFRPLHVLEQVDVLCGIRLVPPSFSGVVPPRRGSPRFPLQRLGLVRKLRYQFPPPLIYQRGGLWVLGVFDVGEGEQVLGVCLLAGYFPGVVASGSGSPGRPLQSLSFLWQLWHWHALLLVPDEVEIWKGKNLLTYLLIFVYLCFTRLQMSVVAGCPLWDVVW